MNIWYLRNWHLNNTMKNNGRTGFIPKNILNELRIIFRATHRMYTILSFYISHFPTWIFLGDTVYLSWHYFVRTEYSMQKVINIQLIKQVFISKKYLPRGKYFNLNFSNLTYKRQGQRKRKNSDSCRSPILQLEYSPKRISTPFLHISHYNLIFFFFF